MIKIVGKFMVEVREQVKEKGIKIKIADEAIDWLIEKGFDAKMGARPLQRVIDKDIKRPLAKLMLFGDLKGGGMLSIGVTDNTLTLTAKPKTPKVIVNEISTVNTDQTNN